ncbi:hypothetical protein [Streptomyces sp. NPDC057509]|uniref:hypothetical protein n=1 Tax=Streptomyces sp. NPDC057509 TaxID=3346152 RepID=UPI0036AFD553
MLKQWLSKRGYGPIEDLARMAFERGDRVFAYKFHPSPMKNDVDLAKAIADVEAIGWTVLSQIPQGEGLRRFVSLTFSRREA